MYDLQDTMSNGTGNPAQSDSLAINIGTALSSQSKNLFLPGVDALGNTVLKDFGRGAKVGAFAQIVVAATSGGSATLAVEVISADDAALSVNVNSLLKSAAVPLAALQPGYLFRLGIVPPSDPGQAVGAGGNGATGVQQQYLGFRYTVASANMTGGQIRCWFGPVEALSSGLGGPL